MIIAIDGPAGSGKSTISKKIARALQFTYLDTGAMYRAVTFGAYKAGIDFEDEAALTDFVTCAKVDLAAPVNGDQKVFLDGQDVTVEIRDPDVTRMVKYVAKIPAVRAHLVSLQKAFGDSKDVVTEGRDTTTVVFPNAYLKIYLDGNQEERARRRFIELQEKGMSVTFEEILKDQQERDRSDFERAVGPLKKADDAVVVDTTHMTIDEVAQTIVRTFRQRREENERVVYKVFRVLFWCFFKVFHQLEVHGAENIPNDCGVLIAGNHASVLDPIILGLGARRQLSFMAKKTLFERPFLGRLISLVNVYPVDRDKADTHALLGGVKMVHEKKAVVIFPEGTRTADGKILDAKRNGAGFIAAQAGCAIVPAYIHGTYQALSKGKKWPKPGKIAVVFGKPIEVRQFDGSGKERYKAITAYAMTAIRALKAEYIHEG